MYYTARLLPREFPKIGVPYEGGIIAYILVNGDPGYDATKIKGLIVAPSLGAHAWSNVASTSLTGTTAALGTGLSNSNLIVSQTGHISSAAKLCLDFRGGGLADWFLPSKDELNKLFLNRSLIGGFDYTWSSTQAISIPTAQAYMQWSTGESGQNYKSDLFAVRPVRSFTINYTL